MTSLFSGGGGGGMGKLALKFLMMIAVALILSVNPVAAQQSQLANSGAGVDVLSPDRPTAFRHDDDRQL